jgi:hypothetical protein
MAASSDYEKRYVKMFDEIAASDDMEVLHEDRGEVMDSIGDADEAFGWIARLRNVELPPSMKECFFRRSQLAIHWQAADPGTAAGELNLINIVEAIAAGAPRVGAEAEDGVEPEAFRIFDDHPRGGTGTFSALRLADGPDAPEVWFYSGPRGYVKLELDYCAYLDTLLVTKGFYTWQYLFADATLPEKEAGYVTERMRLMLDFLPPRFPDYDYSPLEARLKAWPGSTS